MKLVNFLYCYFSLPFCFFRGGSFTDDRPDSSRPQTASSSRSDLVYSGRQQKSWKFDGYSSDNDVMPCVHFKAVFTLFRTVGSIHSGFHSIQWVPFTSATVRIPVSHYTKVWHRTLRYVTLHHRDRRGADSLLYRNRVEIIVLMYEQNPYSVKDFRAGATAIRYGVNIALKYSSMFNL